MAYVNPHSHMLKDRSCTRQRDRHHRNPSFDETKFLVPAAEPGETWLSLQIPQHGHEIGCECERAYWPGSNEDYRPPLCDRDPPHLRQSRPPHWYVGAHNSLSPRMQAAVTD